MSQINPFGVGFAGRHEKLVWRNVRATNQKHVYLIRVLQLSSYMILIPQTHFVEKWFLALTELHSHKGHCYKQQYTIYYTNTI